MNLSIDHPPVEGTKSSHRVDQSRCIRCAACESVAPGMFAVGAASARALRGPADAAELLLLEAAVLLCPTNAIRREADDGG